MITLDVLTIFSIFFHTKFWLDNGITIENNCLTFYDEYQGWGQVQYLYLSTYLLVLDALEYLVYENVKVLVLDQKVFGT